MKELKVLQIILPLGMGGVEKVAYTIHSYLIKNNIKSYIAINSSMYEKFVQHFGIKETQNIIKYKDGNVFRIRHEFQKIINKISPDVIQTHARKECLLVSLCRYNGVHIRTQHMQEVNRIPITKLEKKILGKKVNIWVATSDKLRKEYLIWHKNIPEDKTITIYNGVSRSAKIKSKNYRIQNKFCAISRLTVQKGLDILLSEIAKMPQKNKKNILIDIYGEGDQENSLKMLSAKLNLNRIVKFHHAVNNTAQIASKYDALLMPSRYEGLPLTMLESMSVGTPVAIHNVGCVDEIIKNNVNGWIIGQNNTWNEFFDNFINHKFNYSKIVNNAINTYEKEFLDTYMAKQYLVLYKKLAYN